MGLAPAQSLAGDLRSWVRIPPSPSCSPSVQNSPTQPTWLVSHSTRPAVSVHCIQAGRPSYCSGRQVTKTLSPTTNSVRVEAAETDGGQFPAVVQTPGGKEMPSLRKSLPHDDCVLPSQQNDPDCAPPWEGGTQC